MYRVSVQAFERLLYRFAFLVSLQLVSSVGAAGCLDDPAAVAGCGRCASGTDGGTLAAAERERSFRPPFAPLDASCLCPVLPECTPGAAPVTDPFIRSLDGGGAVAVSNAPTSGCGGPLVADVDHPDDASSPVDGATFGGDPEAPDLAAPRKLGDLIITEIMPDPSATTDAVGEWIELFNPHSAEAFDLYGCELGDDEGVEGVIESGLVVAPGGFVTVARSADPGFAPDGVCPGLSLRNSGGDQVVLGCDGTPIDRAVYATTHPGRSLSLDPSLARADDNDDPSSWCVVEPVYGDGDRGTPASANPSCSP